jgi:C-terminal processing protease CtpA/Prc
MPSTAAQSVSLKYEKRPDGTLLVSQAHSAAQQIKPAQEIEQLGTAIAGAKRIIFDLRSPDVGVQFDKLSHLLDSDAISGKLINGSLDRPGRRTWVHNGLPPYTNTLSSDYHSAFYVKAGSRVSGSGTDSLQNAVLLIGQYSRLPEIAGTLVALGKATILAESPHYALGDSDTLTLDMGEQIKVVVRLSEPVFPGGTGLPEATLVSHENALARAANPPLGHAENPRLPPYPNQRQDNAYADTPYPSAEYRILAAYKIWGVFRNFFAYRDLMDEDWDQVLADFLPKFEIAKDAREYNLTIAEMLIHVDDSHTSAESTVLTDYFGAATTALRLRLIERKPIVAQILDQDARKAGIEIGDMVTKVDGEDIVERLKREVHYISSSTQQSLGLLVMSRILNGPDGSTATLTVKNANGPPREVKLVRKSAYSIDKPWRNGDVVKLLPGNIGYVDLERLDLQDVDGMFEKLRDTKAIVFDARGSLPATAWSIASRLVDKQDVAAAFFNGPLTQSPDLPTGGRLSQSTNYFYVQSLPHTEKWPYKGKTVMLIDERTISHAEHAGLAFEAANKTAFIGSPTAGADSDMTNFVVPGGVVIQFSGRDVRHANGGQLQRLGIQPTVLAPPTIDDIRKGRDVALEKAIEYVQ